jgi:hypothetical protein
MKFAIQHSYDGQKWHGGSDNDPLCDIPNWGYNLTLWRDAIETFKTKAANSTKLPKHYRLIARVGIEIRVLN